MALKQIKSKIRATERTGKVTKAMEAVSAVKMRKSQERALGGRAYARAALRILTRLSATQEGLRHPYAEERIGSRHLYIVVTSDKGLAGSVNSAVLKLLETQIAGRDAAELSFVAFGRKAHDYLEHRGYHIRTSYTNLSDDVDISEMEDVVALVTEAFVAGECDRVSIIYQNFLSTFEQEPALHQLLPISEHHLARVVRGIRPTSGAYASDDEDAQAIAHYTIEPNAEEVLAMLVPRLLRIMAYHALLESKASEHSARMVAMKNATDKAKEVSKSLTLLFNKERQAVITREVAEITGGIEAMSSR